MEIVGPREESPSFDFSQSAFPVCPFGTVYHSISGSLHPVNLTNQKGLSVRYRFNLFLLGTIIKPKVILYLCFRG